MNSSPLGGPRAPEQITAPWLTDVLHADGTLDRDHAIVGVTVEEVGDLGGVNGEAYRLHLHATGAAPATLIAKFPANRAGARRTAAFQRWYEREVRFYREVGPATPLRTARCHIAEIDADGEYVLLLEDLRPRVQGDQLASCTLEQATAAVAAAATLHARWWGDAAPEVAPDLPDATVGLDHANGVQGAVDRSWTRASARLDFPEALSAGMPRLVAGYPALLEAMCAPPVTLVHGDYRLDNLFFGGDGEVVPIDWQFLCRYCGAYDVGYFAGLDLDPAMRRTHERALVEGYVAALEARGVRGYGVGAAWRDYRRALMLGFAVFLIGAAGEQPNERMARVHEVGLARLGTAIVETDALATIPER